MAKKKTNSKKPQSKPNAKRNYGEAYYKDKLKKRFWMLINYISIPFVSALVFGFAAGCEVVLYKFLWSLMESDIQQSVILKNISGWVQIALTVGSLITFIVHSAFSLYGQIQVERQISDSES